MIEQGEINGRDARTFLHLSMAGVPERIESVWGDNRDATFEAAIRLKRYIHW